MFTSQLQDVEGDKTDMDILASLQQNKRWNPNVLGPTHVPIHVPIQAPMRVWASV